MNVLIYGGGAVGLGIASALIRADAGVTILARRKTVEMLNRAGLTVDGIFGEYHASPSSFSAYDSLDKINNRIFDFVLVCTKSYDTEYAAADLHQHSRILRTDVPATKIVSFQNGWGNADVLSNRFHENTTGCARVITGFVRPAENRVTITVHADPIHAGSPYHVFDVKTLEPLCSLIAKGGIPCHTVGDIIKDLWAKMLYNCALNPLGAIFSVRYGTLAEDCSMREIMNTVIDEIYGIMETRGFSSHWRSALDYREAFYSTFVPPTASHESSMLQDIKAGKKTEIDALNGAVVRMANDPERETPINAMLVRMIRFIEIQNQIRRKIQP